MDGRSIDRIRKASFAHAVRGYDRNEVDAFLHELAEWLESIGGDAPGSEIVRAELERVGERTTGILTEAHDAAEGIREDATRDVRKQLVDANVTVESLRASAEEYSEKTREEADAYGRRTRNDADVYAEQSRSEIEADTEAARLAAAKAAEAIAAEANRRRQEVEETVAELERRRYGVLAELDRLASGIAGAATQHRGAPAATAEAEGNPSSSEAATQAPRDGETSG